MKNSRMENKKTEKVVTILTTFSDCVYRFIYF